MEQNEQIITNENSEVVNETEVQGTSQPEVTTEETHQEADWEKIKSEDDYKRLLQSTASKAKKEIMEELKSSGFTSLDDVRKLKTSYEELTKNFDSLDASKKESDSKFNSLQEENQGLKEKLLLKDLNIADEYKDDFLKFSKALVSDQKNLETAAKEVAEKYQMFKNVETRPVSHNIGVEKRSSTTEPDPLTKKYSWLQD